MPTIYNIIYEQTMSLVRFNIEKEDGTIDYSYIIPDQRWIKPIVHIISSLLYVLFALIFGVFLWNKGLEPVFPGLIAKMDGGKGQQKSPYTQFVLTFFAIGMLI